MKRFLLKVLLYVSTTVGLLYGIAFFAGPSTDEFYLRFTTPKQGSLVLGNSRAAQGIVPEVMNPVLAGHDEFAPLYNFSFTIGTSPFGEPYYHTALRKLDTKIKNSIFILAVDPWSISTYSLDSTGTEVKFREQDHTPNNMHFLDLSPNTEYLLKNMDNRAKVIRRYFLPGNIKIMDDGSLAVQIQRTKEQFDEQLKIKLEDYQGHAHKNRFSSARFRYLRMTIDTLRTYGPVVLVRMPIHPELKKIEDSFMPNFDDRIKTLGLELGVPYFSHIDDGTTFETHDGNHLTRKAAVRFSEFLALEIVTWLKNQPERAVANDMRPKSRTH